MRYGSSILYNIYNYSPQCLKNSFASYYGYLQRRKRYGKYYRQYKSFLHKSQYWSNKEIQKKQISVTIDFINYALSNIPFYQNNSDYPKKIEEEGQIYQLPIITKQNVRQNLTSFYGINLRNAIWNHTSGTTGSAIIFPINKECFQKEYAFRQLHYNWGKVSLEDRDRIAIISGHPVTQIERTLPPFWVNDYFNNWLYFSSYHLSWTNLKFYIAQLEKFKPQMIHGYPSSLFLLAQGYKKYGSGTIKLKSIFSSSETLLDYQRKIIEENFGVNVFNWYGTSEMNANIVECDKGELHLKLEHSFVEIINKNDKYCLPGESGRIISTNVGNTLFPLIRYDNGDVVTIAKNSEKSICGRSGIIIKEISGRIEDYIYTSNGRAIGRLDHIFKNTLNVKEAQIQQDQIGEIVIRVVKGERYSNSDEKLILNEARLRLGSNMKIKFEYTNDIQRTANGKFCFIISNINQRNFYN